MLLETIILAAGAGTRMHSSLPKVLHELGGRPMLHHVLDVAAALDSGRIHLVVGHGADAVRESARSWQSTTGHRQLVLATQAEQRGTGHAVATALPGCASDSRLLILYGDVPLLRVQTLADLLALDAPLAVLTATADEPAGYGRILRTADGALCGIVEHRDATEAERAIHEINTGILSATCACLRDYLTRLRPRNAQGELYLTDIVALAVQDGLPVASSRASFDEVRGVNDQQQRAVIERLLRGCRSADDDTAAAPANVADVGMTQ